MQKKILSAKGCEADRSKGLALGADADMTKPFFTKDLLPQVMQLPGENS
jgi:DNA-binding response OmpR family regulator